MSREDRKGFSGAENGISARVEVVYCSGAMLKALLCAILLAVPVYAEDAKPPVRARALPSPAPRGSAMLEKVPNGVLDSLAQQQKLSREESRAVRISGDFGVRVIVVNK